MIPTGTRDIIFPAQIESVLRYRDRDAHAHQVIWIERVHLGAIEEGCLKTGQTVRHLLLGIGIMVGRVDPSAGFLDQRLTGQVGLHGGSA